MPTKKARKTPAKATGDAVGGDQVCEDDKRDAADGQFEGAPPPQGGTETATGASTRLLD